MGRHAQKRESSSCLRNYNITKIVASKRSKSLFLFNFFDFNFSIKVCDNLRRDYAVQEMLEASMLAPGGDPDGYDTVSKAVRKY